MQKLLTILFFFFRVIASSQPTLHPDHWMLDASKSDEFSGSTLDTSKWWAIYPCEFTNGIPHGYNGTAGSFFRPENVSVNNGNLVFKVEYNPDTANDSF